MLYTWIVAHHSLLVFNFADIFDFLSFFFLRLGVHSLCTRVAALCTLLMICNYLTKKKKVSLSTKVSVHYSLFTALIFGSLLIDNVWFVLLLILIGKVCQGTPIHPLRRVLFGFKPFQSLLKNSSRCIKCMEFCNLNFFKP
jgi:hypothetical protein